jgi:hypothetical protein
MATATTPSRHGSTLVYIARVAGVAGRFPPPPLPAPSCSSFSLLILSPPQKTRIRCALELSEAAVGGGPTREGADRKSPPPSALFSPSAAALMKGKLRDEATTNGSSLAHISCGVGA